MPRISVVDAGGQNICAMLDCIAWSEIGPDILADPVSDDGYKVLVGSRPAQVLTFSSYADHPHALVQAGSLESSAAGRYQILYRDWPYYRGLLQLPDFGPLAQDRYAIRQLLERGALSLIMGGMFDMAIARISNIWASLAGSRWGQHTNSMDALRKAFTDAGGVIT